MAYKITWLDEPWLMFVEYYDRMTYRDIEEVMQVCIPQAQAHPIYFLLDISRTERFDPAMLRSQAAMKLLRQPNTRMFVVVGVKGLFKIAINYFSPFAQFKLFDNMDEARAFVVEEIEKEKQAARQPNNVPPA